MSGFPPERRGSALGISGASAGASNLLGPLLGGLLTVALGWRADWWALVPLAILAAWAIVLRVPRSVHSGAVGERAPAVNNVVIAATFLAGLTFAVMIGSFYMAEQYLQRVAGYSALGAGSVLVLVALLVGVSAPIAGRLVDRYGEQFPAMIGFAAAGLGLLVLGLPSVSLRSAGTFAPLIPVGVGLGILFVPVSRAALNSTPISSHGRTSAFLSVGRLLGAAAGAGFAGLAVSGAPTAPTVHNALLLACALCLIVGVPASTRLRTPAEIPHPLRGAAH